MWRGPTGSGNRGPPAARRRRRIVAKAEREVHRALQSRAGRRVDRFAPILEKIPPPCHTASTNQRYCAETTGLRTGSLPHNRRGRPHHASRSDSVPGRPPRRRLRRRLPADTGSGVYPGPRHHQPHRAQGRPVQPRARRGFVRRRPLARARPGQPQRHARQRRTARRRTGTGAARRNHHRADQLPVRRGHEPAAGPACQASRDADGVSIKKRSGKRAS